MPAPMQSLTQSPASAAKRVDREEDSPAKMNPYYEALLMARKDALASLNAALTIIAPITELVNSLNRQISLEYPRSFSEASNGNALRNLERTETIAEPVAQTTASEIDSRSVAAGSATQAVPTRLRIKEELDQDDLPLYQRYVQRASKKTSSMPKSPTKVRAARQALPILRLNRLEAELNERKSRCDIKFHDQDIHFEHQKNSSSEGAARTRAVIRRSKRKAILS